MEQMGFVGRVAAEWLPGTRNMRLVEPFTFVDSMGFRWTAPVGYETNGASIPRILWSIAGSPFDGPYRRAAVIHDWGCDARPVSSKQVHRMFYDAMLADGVDQDTATRFYAAVRLFGPRWELEFEGNALRFLRNVGPSVDELDVVFERAGL